MIASTPADDPATSPLRLDEIVDTDAWFLNRCGSPVSAEIAARACLDLRETNCALIMRPGALEIMRHKAAELEADAVNVNYSCSDDNRPADHLCR